MKRILLLIFVLALILRFYKLGENPPSLYWDEVSLGYNAYSILKTARDEYGSFLPLSIRSFGDYKPPLYTYFTVVPVALFGLNEYSVRFISALFGFLTIFITYKLTRSVFPNNGKIALLAMLLLSISPWHIQFSRTAFESNLALFFVISGVLMFLTGVSKGRWFIVSGLFFGISLYAYHSPRLIAPALLAGMTILFLKQVWKYRIYYLIGLSLFILLFIPIILTMRSTGARFGSVSVVNPDEKLGTSISAIESDQVRGDLLGKLTHNRRIVFAREIIGGYLDHFNFDFLFLTGDAPGRHHAAGMGMLYIIELPFILIGLFWLVRHTNRYIASIFVIYLVAPLASALTSGTPHAVRALTYLPAYQVFTAYGLIVFIRRIRFYNNKVKIVLFYVLCFMFYVNIFYYLRMYYIHTPIEYSQWWQYGYKDAVWEVSKIENRFDKVIVTYRYDQPYIYFLFYNKVDPSWYQSRWQGEEIQRASRAFGKYEFRNLDWEKDSKINNVILVGSAEEIPESASGIIREIKFLDGTVAFRIVARQ